MYIYCWYSKIFLTNPVAFTSAPHIVAYDIKGTVVTLYDYKGDRCVW